MSGDYPGRLPTRFGKKWDWLCPTCRDEKQRSDRYDAYFCQRCDEWLEPECSDDECDYCAYRPNKPSLCSVEDLADWEPAEE